MKGQKFTRALSFFLPDPVRGWGQYFACWAGMGVCVSLAAAPGDPNWIALESSLPAKAGIHLIENNDSRLSFLVTIPGFISGTHEYAHGRFATLGLVGGGNLRDSGKPALPVIRRLIIVPDNAELACSFTGSPVKTSLSALGMPSQFMPVQPPVPKIPGATEAAAFVQDAEVYASPAAYPTSPVSLSEAGKIFGRRLIALEVCPVAITPLMGTVALYSNLVVTITFDKQQLQTTEERALSPREQGMLGNLALNPPERSEAVTATQKRLLLIAPDSFTNGLAPFITYKTSRGWWVDCFTTNSAGTTCTKIQEFIRNRYTNSATRPDALLLAGDVAQIPCFTGVTTDGPDTDLYFGCMDGVGDWQPEFPVGRFSVSSTNQLATVLDKSIAHEQAPLDSWVKRVTFMASRDNYTVSEGTHNEVIATTLSPLGFIPEKLYCYTAGATTSKARKAYNKGCVFGIYSGHGDVLYWADGPYFTQSDINNLTNAAHYPVICSFACLTGQYSVNECFAETWLRAPSKGAVAVLASSVTSYWDEDDILEESLLTALLKENQPQLGLAIWRAKQLYLSVFGAATSTTRRYFEQYNLLGDPTLEIAGLPLLTNGVPVAWFTSQGITNTNYDLELQVDRDGDGMTALQEYLAGTNPNDANSALRLLTGEFANGKITLRWPSATSLLSPISPYQIWSRTNLSVGAWIPQTNLYQRTPPTNEVHLTIPQNTLQLFYRISLTN